MTKDTIERLRVAYAEMSGDADIAEAQRKAHAVLAIGYLTGADMPGAAAAVLVLLEHADPARVAEIKVRLGL